MKKKVFIAIHYLELGGAEISLIGLLQALDYSRYDVDLFVYSHRGELMAYIPKEVNFLPEIPEYAQIERPLKAVLKAGFIKIAIARFIARFRTQRYRKKNPSQESAAGLQYVADAVTPLLPPINHGIEYDLAISFLTPHNIVRDKVKAKKKAAWIHTDYSVVDVNETMELPVWSAYDHIVSISDDVTKSFVQRFPSLEDKIVKIENILSPEFVRQRADEFDALPELLSYSNDPKPIILLTIGRFCYQKNFDNIPDICRRMIEDYQMNDVLWFLIGYGPDEALIRQRIHQAGMENHVIVLGKKENPYPYIKACDIYVQPSRYEGKSVTVREAQMLFKPVVATDYPTVKSQIKDRIDGVIVPSDNLGCANGIVRVISDSFIRGQLSSNLTVIDVCNLSEIQKIDDLV